MDNALPETKRSESLSDGAFAIIITLLVLEIHRPIAAPGTLGRELVAEWSSYVAYVVAFLYVGIIATGVVGYYAWTSQGITRSKS